ncbi:hypothetical protein [Pseudoduganella namucuonensis]|uniref:hypothetical protein n=1 Tax=Pseudoduganella namucuonensis TaxID=1035707 RepID=UPI0011601B0A|nr:hypothetical protein [Pseudoduganella namucuonensis]
MTPIERMAIARAGAGSETKRQGDIDQVQYLHDKAARLASEAAAAQRQPPKVVKPAPPVESEAARQARLIAVLNAARGGGAG